MESRRKATGLSQGVLASLVLLITSWYHSPKGPRHITLLLAAKTSYISGFLCTSSVSTVFLTVSPDFYKLNFSAINPSFMILLLSILAGPFQSFICHVNASYSVILPVPPRQSTSPNAYLASVNYSGFSSNVLITSLHHRSLVLVIIYLSYIRPNIA